MTLLLLVELAEASRTESGTSPSVNESPQYDASASVMVPLLLDTVESLSSADESFVTRPCVQSVQTADEGTLVRLEVSRLVRLEIERSWPSAAWRLVRRSVTQKVELLVYWRHRPSLTWLKLATTERPVV